MLNIERIRREINQLKLTKEAEIAAIQNELKDAEIQLKALASQASLPKEIHLRYGKGQQRER
jgi:hypothetical protein